MGYFPNVRIGIGSLMSKTRSKQGIEGKCEDLYNVSKTFLKQVIEAEVWDISPMFQYELSHLCLRLDRSKSLRINRGISPMFLSPFFSKVLRRKFGIFRQCSNRS